MRMVLLLLIGFICLPLVASGEGWQSGLWFTELDEERQLEIDQWLMGRGYKAPISKGPGAEEDFGEYGMMPLDRLSSVAADGDHRARYILGRRLVDPADEEVEDREAALEQGERHLQQSLVHGYSAATFHLSQLSLQQMFAPGRTPEGRSEHRIAMHGWLELGMLMNDPVTQAVSNIYSDNPMLGVDEQELEQARELAEEHYEAIRQERHVRELDVEDERPWFHDDIIADLQRLLQM
ncbi:hypothetical protein VCB98_04100 [Gammaproteobacteria bacterium AB-CW1]|uniref:Uncharacterized protein n=1 Tax=Natronospira elongata TaxID=3110268 RepID=A0AAP6JHK7_9GAMM|nr:hypothetical protein [Gammaproteobacteria bacterium AB-CW1]